MRIHRIARSINLRVYVAEHLQKWIQDWTQAGWLTLTSQHES